MKKIFTLLVAAVCCTMVFGQIISVTDGTLADWDNVPSEYLFKTECAPNASMDGLKSVKVYADQNYINLLVEVNYEVVTDLTWTPFHVYINSDNNSATGGFGDQWATADIDIMLESFIFAEGEVNPYNPAVFKWWGADGENGWLWTDPEVDGTPENGWGALIPEGSLPLGNSQIVDGMVEIQLLWKLIPVKWADEFTIGFDIQQSWSAVGILPNANDADDGSEVLAEKLRVKHDSRIKVGDLYYQVVKHNDELVIPEVAKPAAGQTTVVLYVPEDTPAGCYAVGSFDWDATKTEKLFTAVEGADSERWVALTLDWTEGLEFKVLAIPSNPAVAPGWPYQWGKNMDPENDLEEDNVVILQGAGTLVLENQGQPKLTAVADGDVVYIHVKAWATTPVIKPVPCETAAFKHPWGGGDWVYREATKTADATFELNALYGNTGVNVATDVSANGENWYPEADIEFVGDVAQGDSVNFKFISEKSTFVGRMIVTLIEKGYPGNDEPDEAKDITVKAKVPATWTNTITAWVWPTGGDGKEVVPTKEGDWYVVTENCAELNIIFKNGEGWSGAANQTVDITGIKEDACFQLEQEGYSKATYTIVDCLQPIPDGPTSGTENGYDWVDLGLPSGLKWATMNVGATSDKDYGEWYNWGDIQAKTHFSWSTYKWYDTNYTINWGEFYFYAINKYTLDDGWHRGRWYEEQTTTKVVEGVTTYETTYVFTGDNKRVLEPEDDVATVKWGGAWRMPSKAECQELVDNCRWIYGSVDGVMGTKIIGPNGQSIFIPAAGFADPDGTYQVGTGAAFWSNELAYSTGYAYYVHCGNGNVSCDDYYRVRGYSVRPVCMPTTVEDENLSEVSCSDNTTQAKTNASDIDADYEPKAFAYVTYQTEDQDNYASLTEATIPSQIEHNGTIYDVVGIKENAFANSKSLTSVSIPESIATIETKAFYNCSGLTSITIPNSVTTIGEGAFYECSRLTSVTAPAVFFDIQESNWVSYTKSLTYAEVNAGELTADAFGFINRSYKTLKVLNLAATSNTTLADEAFKGCYMLDSLYLPSALTSIPYMAVAECKMLKSISIPATVETIDHSAFENCRLLSEVNFAEGGALTEIGNWAFYNCHELKNVVIPEGVTNVGYAAFYGCTYLKELTLPASMQSVADNGFALCEKLAKMNVNAVVPPVVEARTFENVDRMIPVVVPTESVSAYKAAPVWQEFNIQGKDNVESDLENIGSDNGYGVMGNGKILRNGQLIIIRDGVEYNTLGQAL